MVERKFSKLHTRVRFPYPAPFLLVLFLAGCSTTPKAEPYVMPDLDTLQYGPEYRINENTVCRDSAPVDGIVYSKCVLNYEQTDSVPR